MPGRSYYIINGITIYRILAAPVLVWLLISGRAELYKWLLGFSFFTDAIDGYLARKLKIVSAIGARLDSIADDLTVTAGIIGVFMLKPDFVRQEKLLIIIMLSLLVLQVGLAFIRYRKMTSFHTYIAKVAAILQATFLILLFFLEEVPYTLFYFAAGFTILNLLEEIIMILLLPRWQSDVKGVWMIPVFRKMNKAV